MAPHYLTPPETSGTECPSDVVAPGRQRQADVFRNGVLQADGPFGTPLEARCVQGGLGVQAEIQDVRDDLQVALGLHESTHYAEGTDRFPVVS